MWTHQGRYYFIGSGCTGWAPNAWRSTPLRLSPLGAVGGEGQGPCAGPGAETTFGAQSTFVLPVAGRPGAFILLADRWNADGTLQDSRYVWLPLEMDWGEGASVLPAVPRWDPSHDLHPSRGGCPSVLYNALTLGTVRVCG